MLAVFLRQARTGLPGLVYEVVSIVFCDQVIAPSTSFTACSRRTIDVHGGVREDVLQETRVTMVIRFGGGTPCSQKNSWDVERDSVVTKEPPQQRVSHYSRSERLDDVPMPRQ